MRARKDDKLNIDCDFDVEVGKGSKRVDPDKRRYDQDTKTRKWLAVWVAAVSSVWLMFVAFCVCCCRFQMTPSVMIALLCTSTANVLGLPYIVLHGLFDNKK